MQQGQSIPELSVELERRIFTMSKGEVGTSIAISNGYAIPTLTDIVAAHQGSFEEAKTKVLDDVKADKAKALATEKGNQVQELIKNGKDLASAAKDSWRGSQNQRAVDAGRESAGLRADQ